MKETIEKCLERGILQKIVFSVPRDKTVKKTVAVPYVSNGKTVVQFETFTSDGKALHVNKDPADAAEHAEELVSRGDFSRVNVLTTAGECQVMVSKKGKKTVINKIALTDAPKAKVRAHDGKRRYIIEDGQPCDFLYHLGVCDGNGRVFDRKRAKFRQINRFLEIVRDVFPKAPDGEMYVLDLCCGKSYLTFALYYYIRDVLGAKLKMVGADLKSDVIEFCSGVAEKCGYDGLSFVCCDVSRFVPERTPDLVVSLHACDTATDVVIATAVKSGARALLSCPCCQHEMAAQLPHGGGELDFILSKPLFRERFAALATDALRVLRLEAEGYSVDAVEFIDPEETPKNLLIRAVKTGKKDPSRAKEYEKAYRDLSASPKLARLLDE